MSRTLDASVERFYDVCGSSGYLKIEGPDITGKWHAEALGVGMCGRGIGDTASDAVDAAVTQAWEQDKGGQPGEGRA